VATERQTVTGEWTMAATEFRARCYRLMDEVAETGREIVITKRGKPVARLVPLRSEDSIGDRFVLDPGVGAGAGSHPHPSPLPQVRGIRGQPSSRRRGAPFGMYRDVIRIHGDIGAPIDVEWDAEVEKGWEEPFVLGRVHGSDSGASQRPDCLDAEG